MAEFKITSIPIDLVPRSKYYETSHKQRRDWSYSQILKNRYKMSMMETIDDLNIKDFEMALSVVLKCNDSLRTNFKITDGKIVQVVNDYDNSRYKIKYFDCTGILGTKKLNRIIRMENRRTVDYENDPLISVMVCKLDSDKYKIAVFVEHIIFDETSSKIFRTEIRDYYARISQGESLTIVRKPFQLKDYAAWINKCVEHNANVSYWKRVMSMSEYTTNFQEFYKNCGIQKFRKIKGVVGVFRGFITGELVTSIDVMAKQYKSRKSFFMITTFVILISLLFKKRNLLISTMSMGRRRNEFNDLLACCSEPIFLFISLDFNLNIGDTIRMIENVFFSSIDHLFPWGEIHENPAPDKYLMQTNYIFNEGHSVEDVKCLPSAVHSKTKSSFVRSYSLFNIIERSDRIEFLFNYSLEIYCQQMIQLLFEKYLLLLRMIKQNPNTKIVDLMDINKRVV